MRSRHAREPGKSGIAVAAHVICLAKREIRVWPIRIKPRRFPQFAQTRFIFRSKQAADVMFKGVQAQRPLRFRKFRQAARIRVVVGGEQPPQELDVEVHQGIERTAFAYRREQRRSAGPGAAGHDIDAKNA